jgi:hypothetical protein
VSPTCTHDGVVRAHAPHLSASLVVGHVSAGERHHTREGIESQRGRRGLAPCRRLTRRRPRLPPRSGPTRRLTGRLTRSGGLEQMARGRARRSVTECVAPDADKRTVTSCHRARGGPLVPLRQTKRTDLLYTLKFCKQICTCWL